MTLHRLKIWVAVAKHLGITKAAKELRIRQPSVTQQIKLLEKEFGLKLYNVTGRGIEVTQAGRVVLKYAKRILSQVDSLEKQLTSRFRRRRRRK